MKNFVFGYGSLINLQSAEKTLGRAVRESDVQIVNLVNYSRVWRLIGQVIVDNYQDPVNAAFLDIAYQNGAVSNGILIEVTSDELKKLDKREKHYRRINITQFIRPQVQDGKIFTYQGEPEFFADNFPNPVVLTQYVKMVEQGTEYWGKEFSDQFNKTTRHHQFKTVDGHYKFYDVEQSILTGRD